MFVVLGVIVVLTLLGFWGIQIAENDSRLSGGTVDIKSMNMAAVSGLSMAVAQMSKDDDNLVAMINDFKASVGTGAVKEWIVFDGAALSLSSKDPGFTTTLGTDKTSCKVRILGIEKIGASASAIGITLESTGRGRNGDLHTAVATYEMSGLNSSQSTNSAGPVNAFHSIGGFDGSGFNQKIVAEGGVYSGGGLLILQTPDNDNKVTRVRAAGDVQLNTSVVVDENVVINGFLSLNGGTMTLKKNLVVRGNLKNNTTLDVAGSMFFGGGTESGYRSGELKIGKDFLVPGKPFVYEGKMTVGQPGSLGARAWFFKGINIDKSADPLRTIHGSMYVKNDPANDDGLRDFVIKKNLRYLSGSSKKMRFNGTVIEGDAYFEGALSSGNKDIDGGTGLTVNGRATLLNGFVENFKQHNKFVGSTYWKADNQAGLVGATGKDGSFQFGGEVSMNGTQAPDWFNKWSFFAGPKKWSYKSMNPKPCSPLRDAGTIVNGVSVSCRTNDEPAPDYVEAFPDTTGFLSLLGYSADDLDVRNNSAINASSSVNTGNLPSAVLTAAKWSKMKQNSGSCLSPSTYRPTADQIACIYNLERSRYAAALAAKKTYTGPLFKGFDGNYKFLIIDVDEDWSVGSGLVDAQVVIPKGVHVMFIITAKQANTGTWYTNEEGSTQIVYVKSDVGKFGWKGTVHGFVQFDVASTKIQLSSGDKEMILYGAMESVQPTSMFQPNDGYLKVSITDSKAKTVRDEIVKAFTNTTTSSAAGDVIRFSGDRGVKISMTQKLTTNDGWVQFLRIGEYR